MTRISPLAVSTGLHFGIIAIGLIAFAVSRIQVDEIDFDVVVVEQPTLAPQADIDLTKPRAERPAPPLEPEARKVFGVTRDSLRTESETLGVDAKAGNTIATAPDDEKLRDDDATRIPIPVEEYLISAPPQLLESFKPQYPAEARERNIEGAVRVEILIDREGRVRTSRVIQGLGFGTEEAALEAASKLRFKPAEVEGQAVAVKIQFVINFELER